MNNIIKKNSAWTILSNLFNSGINFILFVFIARYLGASDFGSFVYVFSIATLFSMMGQAGLDGLLSRELIEKKESQNIILGTATIIRLCGYLFGMIMTIMYAYLIPSHSVLEKHMFLIASLFVLSNILIVIPENWLKSMNLAHISAKARIWSNLISVFIKIFSLIIFKSAVILAVMHFLSQIILSIFTFFYYKKNNGPNLKLWSFEILTAKKMLSESWHLFISALLWVLYMRIDLTLLRYMSGPEMVAQYSIATRFAEVTYAIPSALIVAFFPAILKSKEISKKEYEKLLQDLLFLFSLFGFLVLIIITLFSYFGIILVFGEQYSKSVWITIIYMISTPFFFIHYLTARWILVERLTKFGMYNDVIGIIIKLVLSLILIHYWGPEGAAFATIISYAILAWGSLFFIREGRVYALMIFTALCKPWKGIPIAKSKFK